MSETYRDNLLSRAEIKGARLYSFRKKSREGILLALLTLLAAFSPSIALAATVAWISPSSGNWSTAANWETGTVPGPADDVIINVAGDITVTIDSGTNVINSLISEETVHILGGSLSVSGPSEVNGEFRLNFGRLIATGSAASFTANGITNIDNGRFDVLAGALVEMPNATDYNTSGLLANLDSSVILVDGLASRLVLSNVATLTLGRVPVPFTYPYTQIFRVQSGGFLDLSGVLTITGAAQVNWTKYARFEVYAGGTLSIPNLVSTNGAGLQIWSYVPLSLDHFSNMQGLALNLWGVNQELPALTTMENYSFLELNSVSVVNAPLLSYADMADFLVRHDSILNIPNITSVNRGYIGVYGSGQFNSSTLTDIDNTYFDIEDGAVFDNISDTTLVTSGWSGAYVYGSGSLLDLSMITSYTTESSWSNFGAETGGVIDFSGITTINNIGTDWDLFWTWDAGTILFSSLVSVTGNGVEFDLDSGMYLPALTSASATIFWTEGSAVIPSLTTLTNNSWIHTHFTDILTFPALTLADGTRFELHDGGIINAPNLTTLRNAEIWMEDSTSRLNTGYLTNIDETYFELDIGASFDRVSATSYDISHHTSADPLPIYLSNGSLLDLSSVENLIVGQVGTSYGTAFYAYGNSTLDLSGLRSITNNWSNFFFEFYADTGADIDLSGLPRLDTPLISFEARNGASIDASGLLDIVSGPVYFSSYGLGSIIDLDSLCVYVNTTFTESAGGEILQNGLPLSEFESGAVFGSVTADLPGTCGSGFCPKTEVISFLPGGHCLRNHGEVTLAGSGVDLDGMSLSDPLGILSFEVLHDLSGAATGSRLVSLIYSPPSITVIGPELPSRVIRGAALLGNQVWAIDVQNNQLIKVGAATGTLNGTPLPLTYNSLPYDVSEQSDIVFGDNKLFLSDNNAAFQINVLTGVLTLIGVNNTVLPGGSFLKLAGAAFGTDALTQIPSYYLLNVSETDSLLGLSTTGTPFLVSPSIPSGVDAILGDLATLTTVDPTPPSPVTISMVPQGDGSTVQVNWTSYNEAQNGGDINHYTVYKSLTNFTDASTATVAGQTLSGQKTFQLTNLNRDEQIFVAVVATDVLGNENLTVTAVPVTPIDIVPPGPVSNVQAVSGQNNIPLTWTAPGDSDLAYFRVYRNSQNVSGDIPAGTTQFDVTGLNPATSYNVKVTAVDESLNESSGTDIPVATWLLNPGGVVATPHNSSISLVWNAASPPQLVSQYRIFAETTPFSSVQTLTPKQVLPSGTLSTTLNNLENDTEYFIAVTVVNTSQGTNPTVATVSATPFLDNTGPEISNELLGGQPLGGAVTIGANSTAQATVTDLSGVGRVEFYYSNGGAPSHIATAVGAGPNYSALWNVTGLSEGSYTLTIKAFDTLDNFTEENFPVTIDFAPPPPPVITAPQSGLLTNLAFIQVAGTAAPNTTVNIFRGGAVVAGPINAGATGAFEASIELLDGENIFTAKATGVGGESAPSAPVTVTLDSTIPDAPIGVSSQSLPAGKIRVTWQGVGSGLNYDLYRADHSFATIEEATKVNTTSLTTSSFTDELSVDDTYFYRVVSKNAAGSISPPSNITSAAADGTPPDASITYTTTEVIDPTMTYIGIGLLTIDVTMTEPLLAVPFLSYAFGGAAPINVSLVQTGPAQYRGSVQVTPDTSNGVGIAVFSARDLVGNQGTSVSVGGSMMIDSRGPAVQALSINPPAPVQNDSGSPVTITVTFDLDEDVATGTTPEISYVLSGSAPTPTPITNVTLVNSVHKIWEAVFELPSTAGAAGAESLSFTYSAEDTLGNIKDTITVLNQFELYQGELPALPPPFGLTGEAISGGRVELHWNPVLGASGYQLFRMAPGEIELTPRGPIVTELTYIDSTTVDAQHSYAVASVREENGQQSLSGLSAIVVVTSDSVPPTAPSNLALTMNGSGVLTTWAASLGDPGEIITYSLYRQNLAPGVPINPAGLTPIIDNIISLAAIDSSPSEAEHAYAVTASDEAGNESDVSETEYLNFALVPVNTLTVEVSNNTEPQVTWSYNGTAAVEYRLEHETGGATGVLFTGAALAYSDVGYAGGERRYTVFAIDRNRLESEGRSLLLPAVTVTPPQPLAINRGVFNEVVLSVTNYGSTAVANAVVAVEIGGVRHESAPVTLQPGTPQDVQVVVGGYDYLAASEAATISFEVEPNPGEFVTITNEVQASVTSQALVYSIDTEAFTLGSTGNVRFSVENTSAVTTEIITAKSNGAQASNEVRFILKDIDENFYSTTPFKQFFGGSVITLPNGTTVARVAPGETFTSDWMAIPVPSSVPTNSKVQLVVDKIHYGVGTAGQLSINGSGTTTPVSLSLPPYYGEVVSIAPQSSFGEDILITGRALDSTTDEPEAFVPLEVVLSISGFEYKKPVYTGSNGEFTLTIDPSDYAPGSYKVSALYPNTIDRPEHGEFVINSLSMSHSIYVVNAPVNYVIPFSVTVTAGPATQSTGVQLQYNIEDQIGQQFPEGIQITLPAPINLSPGQQAPIQIQFSGDSSAATSGQLYLRLISTETGSNPVKLLRVDYTLSSANPILKFTPSVLETGVVHGGTASESISLQNIGFAPLVDAQIEVLTSTGDPAPWWVYSTTSPVLERLEIGETKQIDLYFSPDTSVTVAYHHLKVRVSAGGSTIGEMPIVTAVTQDGIGGVLAHVSDIYTATLDENMEPIPGLAGASVRLQHETIPTIFFTGVSDAFGEVLFDNVPTGSYTLRGAAPGHSDDVKQINVVPGITKSAELFLLNEIISVFWSVTEITIEDYYQIILTADFVTNVPVAVLVLQPSGIQLPDMQPGDTFLGELTLTNYGLINATGVTAALPSSDSVVQYEFLASIPETMAPGQTVTIPYRATALQALTQTPPGVQALTNGESGGICYYSAQMCVSSLSICANGQAVPGNTCSHWIYSKNCSTSSPPPPGYAGGGGSGGGGSSGGSPGGSNLPQIDCLLGILCGPETAAPGV